MNLKMSGGDSEEATPVPISNTVVKLFSADGSWGFSPARAGRCRALLHFLQDLYSINKNENIISE